MDNKTKEQLLKEVDQLRVEIAKLEESDSEYKKTEKTLKESKERYKGIIQSTASCIAVYEAIDKGKDFVFIDFNPMAEKVEQISKDKVIGKKVSEVFPGVMEFGLFKVFQNVWKTGKPEHFPVSVYKDERIQGYRENYIYKLSSGEIVAVYQDFTERKQAEDELTQSLKREKTQADIVRNTPVAIAIGYPDGRLANCNPAFSNLTGYLEEELQRISWNKELTPAKWLEIELEELKKISFQNNNIKYEKEYIHKNGKIIPIELVVAAKFDDDKNLLHFLGFITDITERKQVEEKIKKHQENLEGLVKERTIELEEKNKKLDDSMKVFVGRELMINKLQDRIRALEGE